jgi:hypothetical protein
MVPQYRCKENIKQQGDRNENRTMWEKRRASGHADRIEDSGVRPSLFTGCRT